MTKSELVRRISEKLPRMSQKEMERLVDTVFESMAGALKEGGRVELRGFGTFEVRVRDPRLGRNPKSGEKVSLASRRVPFFRAGKELKDLINNGSKSRT